MPQRLSGQERTVGPTTVAAAAAVAIRSRYAPIWRKSYSWKRLSLSPARRCYPARLGAWYRTLLYRSAAMQVFTFTQLMAVKALLPSILDTVDQTPCR